MGSGQRSSPRRGIDLVLALVLLASVSLGPRLMDARACLEWVRYYSARGVAVVKAGEAPKAGRQAARAIERAAPLPIAAEAARLALDLGKSLEPGSRPAAHAIYADVRRALDAAAASAWRGRGLGELAAEADRLEEASRP